MPSSGAKQGKGYCVGHGSKARGGIKACNDDDDDTGDDDSVVVFKADGKDDDRVMIAEAVCVVVVLVLVAITSVKDGSRTGGTVSQDKVACLESFKNRIRRDGT